MPDTTRAHAWTVRYSDAGELAQLRPASLAVASAYLDTLRAEDPGAVLVDLTAEIEARFPAGTRVRNSGSGRTGTVTAQDASLVPQSRAAPGVLVHCTIDHAGDGLVCVRLDGSPHPDWYAARWIEPASEAAARPE